MLGLATPLIQAPMAGVQDYRLALAVCEAGGLGSLPCAMLGPDALRREVEALRAGTELPYNLNFFCHPMSSLQEAQDQAWREALMPYYSELGLAATGHPVPPLRQPFDLTGADLVDALRPRVVSFHFGLPDAPLLTRVKRSGAQVWSSATTVAEARWLAAKGADVIIAQGLEAGGHRGHFLSDELHLQMGTFALVRQVVQAVPVPVIAAGGIADAEGVAAALALGAAGVQVGTAYLLCDEATTSPVHRAALQSAAAGETMLTNLFSGRPARGIVNRLMRELGAIHRDAPPFPLASAALAPLRARAEALGRADFTPLWCGQNASGCQRIGAAELTRRLSALVPA
jgi:nitronate monooxygenase